MRHTLRVLALLLVLAAAACQSEAGSSLRLPTQAPPAGQAPAGQAPSGPAQAPAAGQPAGQPTLQIQVMPPGPGSQPDASGNPKPAPPLPTFPPAATSSVPTPTPLPGATVITAAGDCLTLSGAMGKDSSVLRKAPVISSTPRGLALSTTSQPSTVSR